MSLELKAKLKAKEIYDKFWEIDSCDDHSTYQGYVCSHIAKKSAIIAVNYVLQALDDDPNHFEYWMQVKENIENL